MSDPLSDDEIKDALAGLEGWERKDNALVKNFEFKNFSQAIAFIVRIGFVCEKADHHPELTNVYNRVTLAFTTHDAGSRITERDVDVARKVEKLKR